MLRSLLSLGLLTLFGLWSLGAQAAEVLTLAGTGAKSRSGDGGLASEAAVGEPYGVVIGPDEALYVCEIATHVIRRVDLKTGTISTIAGSGVKGYAGDGGPALEAKLDEPYEVRFDSAGNLLFVEMKNAVVRLVNKTTGTIETVAGTGAIGFSGDGGPARQATMNRPHSIALDRDDNIYVCDIGNHRIRKIDAQSGTITTYSGTGERRPTPDGAPIGRTPLNGPRALDIDSHGRLVLALREGNAIYRFNPAQNRIEHLAGTGKKGYTGHGGPALKAELSGPKGVAVSSNGDIYFADTESHTIRMISGKDGTMHTIVGDGTRGDGPGGDPLHCRLARPHSVCIDAEGNVYIGDSENNKVRVWRP
ncbi:MAG: hypothetical protein KDA80_00790 [Planctomycetaceae bacterium]|nr:hypothetical protein [Planctomycetaceae bacterium]